jgi:hypothetical protein
MATIASALGAFIDSIRKFLKGKEPITSDRVREIIAELEAQIDSRAEERSALEAAWADSLLEATLADQAAHREKLDRFDLETAQGAAALAALGRRLEEVLTQETHDANTRMIARARELALAASEEVREIDALQRQLAQRFGMMRRNQLEFEALQHKLREVAPDRLDLELFSPEQQQLHPPKRWFYAGLLTHREDFSLTSIEDDRVIWPNENCGVASPR